MNALLRIALRVIARRVEAGEDLETILLEYPKLSETDKETIRANLGGQA